MSLIPRVISARLVERFIFNFRLAPEALDARLPATWLKPQVVNGWAVASFCVLKLDRVTVWPIPPLIPYRTTSCAYRCGAIDARKGTEPTVYITDRNTDRGLIAALSPMLIADTVPTVHADVARSAGTVEISVSHIDGQRLFSAEAYETDKLQSELFESVDDFADFIKGGVSSYTPSVKRGKLARVDLKKEDQKYEALRGEVDFSSLESMWRDAGLLFDSAVRALGGTYRWTYRGLHDADRPAAAMSPSFTRSAPA